MIVAKNLSFSYKNKPILENISFSIFKGEVISLLGANGSGKSTLIKLLLKLLNPNSGHILFNGKNIKDIPHKEFAKLVAYVPQSSFFPFSFSVLDVVIMARIAHLGLFSRYTKEDEGLALSALEKVGIEHLSKANYNELSGGQKQLVLIARALAQGANILIMDEPVSGLDFGNQMKLLQTIKELSFQGYTFLQSTHYPDHAFIVSNKSIILHNNKILAQGDTTDIITEQSLKKIYGVDIRIENLQSGAKACSVDI